MIPTDSVLPISGNEGRRHSEYLLLRTYIDSALTVVNSHQDMSEQHRTEALLPFFRVYSPNNAITEAIDDSASFRLPDLSSRDTFSVAEEAIRLGACRNGDEKPTTQEGIEQLCATLEGIIIGGEETPSDNSVADARFVLEQMQITADCLFRERHDSIYGWS